MPEIDKTYRQLLTLAFGLAIIGLIACAIFPPSNSGLFVTIEAQSLPIARTVLWDANAASDAITNYVVRLDNTIVGSPTGTSQPITITTLGTHTVSVTAVNLWGVSAPTTLTINVVAPAQVVNLRLQ